MSISTLKCLIPVPQKVTLATGVFPISKIRTISHSPEATASVGFIKAISKKMKLSIVDICDPLASIFFNTDFRMPPDSWRLTVSPVQILLQASDSRGFMYGAFALIQMLVIGLRKGQASNAVLDCGCVEDSPRFQWRGFMLDSARHFQTPATIKKLLFFFASCRINSFHWHLSDNQAWRWETKHVHGLAGKGEHEDGFYTQDEIHEIVDYSEKLGIRIIPEIDVPGHSRRLLSVRQDLTCDTAVSGNEVCIGNPESLSLLKKIIAELMDLFPHSEIIHIGGDEAATTAWEKCSCCQSAMKSKKFNSFRQLENAFMDELTQFVLSQGRTPMMWATCSGQKYDKQTIMQAWLDIREPIRLAQDGNKVVYSVHNSLYFDYPANLSEPHESWMFELSERGIYMTDPYVIWPEKVKDSILGTEACLWTETVPEWRVMQKILPRLFAYSECAWSEPCNKDYSDFVRRRNLLESAGYWTVLQSVNG